jgi:uncharacterized protein YjgD (DUF1641 family)
MENDYCAQEQLEDMCQNNISLINQVAELLDALKEINTLNSLGKNKQIADLITKVTQ